MTIICIILIFLAYILVGGFVSGLVDADDMTLFVATFWPVFLLGELILLLSRPLYGLGSKVHEWWLKKEGFK